jgi:hypothetical protein
MEKGTEQMQILLLSGVDLYSTSFFLNANGDLHQMKNATTGQNK